MNYLTKLQELWKPFQMFDQSVSWSTLNYCDEERKHAEKYLNSFLELIKTWFQTEKNCPLFELEFVDNVLGMIQRNATKTKVVSPLYSYLLSLEEKLNEEGGESPEANSVLSAAKEVVISSK